MSMPSLVERMAQECTRLVETAEPDGHGGTRAVWSPSGTFQAAISATGPTNDLAMATRPDSVATCTLTAPLGTGLAFHDRIQAADGRLLLVVSEAKDRHTPALASFGFERYECEEVIDG